MSRASLWQGVDFDCQYSTARALHAALRPLHIQDRTVVARTKCLDSFASVRSYTFPFVDQLQAYPHLLGVPLSNATIALPSTQTACCIAHRPPLLSRRFRCRLR